ncbi:MAG: tetratricopeptide repeat protein [Gammaproteobacteria bacterium]|nr:tetratricopeptide repeat protein [Gammaproteobacteria bacterium]
MPAGPDGSAEGRAGARRGGTGAVARHLARAVEAHRRGLADEAERLYRRVLERAPRHRDALHNLGVLAQQRGRLEEAAAWLERAAAEPPADAALLNNLGSVQRTLGRREQALASYRAALSSAPRHANALYNLATLLQEAGDVGGAVECLRRLVEIAPRDAEAWAALGMALDETGETGEALTCFERAVELRPADAAAHYNLANAQRQRGRLDDAESGYRRALELAPDYAEAWHNLGMVLRLRGRREDAEAAFRRALAVRPDYLLAYAGLAKVVAERGDHAEAFEISQRAKDLAPDNLELRVAYGELLLDLDRWEEASRTFESVIEEDPANLDAHSALSKAYTRLHRTSAAIDICRRALSRDAGFADAYVNLGVALRQKGDPGAAIAAYEDAIRIRPDLAEAHNNLGLVHVDLGRIELATECFRKALELDPALTHACLNLARACRYDDPQADDIRHVESLLARDDISDEGRSNLHFALGKMYDDCGEYDRAFAHFRDANRIMSRHAPFNADGYERWLGRFPGVFTRELFERLHGIGLDSERPVFIVGMPRSGTTLVEQIVASHPLVHGGDEITVLSDLIERAEPRLGRPPGYPECIAALDRELAEEITSAYLDYLDTLDRDALRVTDKMPSNFFHLGTIAILLPRARIIHCRRDPMDVCLSNYVQRFAEGHYFSYDLTDTARYYLGYERLMAHWREVLPTRMHEVRYEELVDDQERVSRELIDYLGLDWDPRCLAFHETERAVRTASNWQVRQPMYRGSKRRWTKYAAHLGELERALGLADSRAQQ